MTTDIVPTNGGNNQLSPRGMATPQRALAPVDTASTAAAVRAKAEIEARYLVAHGRPRSIDEARRRILDHCRRPRFAESARYSKPIGKTSIVGASIRFVEAALAEYGNVLVQSSVVWDDEKERRVEISVTDLERNICYPKEVVIQKSVERRFLRKGQAPLSSRRNSYGDVVHLVEATEDDLLTKQGAIESKAIRTLGLRVLPADIVEEAMDQVAETLRSADAEDPAAARKRIADGFAELGVYPRQLEEYLAHPLEATSAAELEDLRVVYATIRDGEAPWIAILEAKREERGETESEKATAKKKSKAGAALAKRKASKAKSTSKPAANDEAPPPTDDDPPPVKGRDVEPGDELDAEMAALRSAIEGGDTSDAIRKRVLALPGDARTEFAILLDEAVRAQKPEK